MMPISHFFFSVIAIAKIVTTIKRTTQQIIEIGSNKNNVRADIYLSGKKP